MWNCNHSLFIYTLSLLSFFRSFFHTHMCKLRLAHLSPSPPTLPSPLGEEPQDSLQDHEETEEGKDLASRVQIRLT